jgi:cobyrinic acid a,c-diamide synthase
MKAVRKVYRLLITGTGSGCGKTTAVCALLTAFKSRGLTPTAFKCGPDYIDPMFHRSVSSVMAYNLDPFFFNGQGLWRHLNAYAGELALIEGAMGYYDGIAATCEASAYTVARETRTPVVLVVSAKAAGHSLEAVLEGFARHRPDSNIKGVIFNDAGEQRYPDLKRFALEAGLTPFGYMPRNAKWELPARHLGLLTAGEIAELQNILRELGEQAERTLDLDGLLTLAGAADEWFGTVGNPPGRSYAPSRVRLAVARDEAFCFHYEENLDLLQSIGCELVFFSPLRDTALPGNIGGLYLGGGYPELHAAVLSGNTYMLESIKRAIAGGLPTVAEGGGFLYLHRTLDGFPMCAVLDGAAYKSTGPRRFGYVTLTANRDNLLCKAGDAFPSREFHYWDSDSPGDSFDAQKAGRDISYQCVHASDSLYAGFPHLYFPAYPWAANNFIKRMKVYEPK